MDNTLSAPQYTAIHDFLERRAGIRLGAGKEYLILSRLSRLLPHFGLTDYAQLVDRLSGLSSAALQAAIVDAMTTNETFWFRDQVHFRILTDSILAEKSQARLRIWSAASSTGQEAYTASFCLQDAMQKGRISRTLNYEIVGTDISPSAVEEAQAARYCSVAAARGLSDEQRQRYFRVQEDCIEVLPAFRERVSFRTFNLLQRFDSLGKFDVIFCRNVLIYFSQERKRDIIERMARALNPGGHLFVGSTESMSGHEDLFEMCHQQGALVYRSKA